MNKKQITNILIYLSFALFIFGVLFYITHSKAIENFILEIENRTFDVRQKLILDGKQSNKNIKIITIDDASYEYILNNFGSWPVTRGVWADIIDGLEASNPKFIVFDLIFANNFNGLAQGDAKLVDAIKRNKNVFVSMSFDNYPAEVRIPPEMPETLKSNLKGDRAIKNNSGLNFINARPLIEELYNVTSNIGVVNILRDEDGLIRFVPPFCVYKNDYYANLTTLVALEYLGVDEKNIYVNNRNELVFSEDRKYPLMPDGRLIANWYGKTGTYEHVPLWQVIQAIVDNDIEFLKSKFESNVVYVGTTVSSLSDNKTVPVDVLYPGVEIQATFLNNFIDNNFIKMAGLKIDLPITLLLVSFVVFFAFRIKAVAISLLASVSLLFFYVVLSIAIMEYFNFWIGLVLPLSFATFVMFFSYVVKYLIKSRDYEHTYKLAVTDGLTTMYNHRYFQEQMIANTATFERYETSFSLILIDIDFFKKFNDKYGHQSGDAVLKQVAQTIKKNIRSTDVACRYGGEEMSVILPNTKKEEAIFVAQKIWKAIRERKFELATGDFSSVTASFGVASMPKDGKEPKELIEFVDKCLYKAKAEGRDRVVSEL